MNKETGQFYLEGGDEIVKDKKDSYSLFSDCGYCDSSYCHKRDN